jgi:hypothetical protein
LFFVYFSKTIFQYLLSILISLFLAGIPIKDQNEASTLQKNQRQQKRRRATSKILKVITGFRSTRNRFLQQARFF